MKRVMCVWFPHWPLQETLGRQPEWKEHPIVLYEAGGRSGQTVVFRSRKAAAVGVKPGMPLAQARVLLDDHKPPARYAAFEPFTHRETLETWTESCLQFSPIVGVEHADVPECILLDIAGCDHLFGGERSMATRLMNFFAERGLVVRVAVADTIGTAWAVAHYGSQAATVIAREQNAAALEPLPIEALRIAPTIIAKLRQLAVRTIAGLQALPRRSLPSRFGQEILRRLDQALGRLPELIPTLIPSVPVTATQEFLAPTRERGVLETTIRTLLEQVVVLAQEQNRGIGQLVCRFLREDKKENNLSVRLLRPTVSASRLWDLVRLQLEELRLAANVWRVHLQAETVAFQQCAVTLFEDADQLNRHHELTKLIERLSSRLGAHAIVQPQWALHPQPEWSIAYAQALSVEHAKRNSSRRGQKLVPPPRTAAFRPTSLAQQPISIEVVSIVPDGPPLRFFRRGHTHTIARCWGPERIETGWWRQQHERRDYYRVETTSGQRFWLFRRLADDRWFLHGVFA